jgi:hypothetical protein
MMRACRDLSQADERADRVNAAYGAEKDQGGVASKRRPNTTPQNVCLLVPGKPAPFMSGEPFHRCTHTALSPKGEIYVSDGYGNARVHKYSPDGNLLKSWGEPGTGEGEFNIVHNICCDGSAVTGAFRSDLVIR